MDGTPDVRQRVLELSTRAGVGGQLLSVADRLPWTTTHDHLDRLDLRADAVLADPEGYVLLPLIPGSTANNYRLALLGYAFRTRGYEPLHLVGSEAFDIAPNETATEDSLAARERSRYEARRTATAFGVAPLSVSELLDHPSTVELPADCESLSHRGVPISEYARASTRKYFKRYSTDLSDPNVRDVYRRFLRMAVLLVDACEEVFDRYDVRAAVTTEDPYVHGGVPLSVAVDRGVPAYSHEMGFRDGTLVFGQQTNRNSQPQFTDRAFLERVMERPLTPDERARTERLVSERTSGKGQYNYSATEAGSVELDEDRTVVGLFTNLVWDAVLETNGGRGVASNPLEWVRIAIERLGGRDDVQLVVKTHPAEDVYETDQTFEGWIREAVTPLPENVELYSPDAAVDTYDLVESLDVGVVYCSTVGLEMAYGGLPVVVAGDAHYGDLGFTFDPESRAEYEELLDAAPALSSLPNQRTLAERYFHFLLFEKCLDFPFYATNRETTVIELLPAAHEDLAPGTEPFDTIVESMLAGDPVTRPALD